LSWAPPRTFNKPSFGCDPAAMPTDIQMQTAKPFRINNFTMGTAKTTNDIYMETAKTGLMPRQGAVKGWEQKLLESPEVMRKATVAQLCELDKHF